MINNFKIKFFDNILSRKNSLSLNIISLMICILPLALITGPFLSDLIISIVGIYFIFISIRNKLFRYYNYTIVKVFFVFYFIILTSSLISINPLLSLESSLFYFRFIFFALGVAYVLEHNLKFLNNFKLFLYATLFALVLDGFIQFLFGTNLVGYKIEGERVSSFFGEELVLGHYLVRIFPILLSIFFITKFNGIKEIIFFTILSLSIFTLILLSGDRSAFLLLIIQMFLLLILLKGYKSFRIVFFLASLTIFIGVIASSEIVKNRLVNSTISQMGIDNSKLFIFSEYHERMFISATKMFIDKPILGHGPKTFRVLCMNDQYYVQGGSCSTHPHNTYIQLMAETGIMGTLIVIGVLAFAAYIFFKQFISLYLLKSKYNVEDYKVCLIVVVFLNLWPIIPTLNFFNNWISILYFLPVGFLLSQNKP
tara:strand:- start:2125 stop:3399 length:1275 start_codon:yes stop_codon:yes gene_type:complete